MVFDIVIKIIFVIIIYMKFIIVSGGVISGLGKGITTSSIGVLLKNCGYKIHAIYPASNLDELPEDDMKRMMYLDEKWMKECVSVLPADSIINIANNVDRKFSYGE